MYNYSLQIDINDGNGFFDIEVENEIKLSDEMVDGMPVYRKGWEELTIKNKPYQYASNPVNSYKLYDLIVDSDPDTTFNIKFTYGSETVLGYFGQVDCDINEDRSLITVTPTIIDQYTDFIENYDTEIDIFGESNLIQNGDFEVWTDGVPDGWSVASGNPENIERAKILEKDCVKIGDWFFDGFGGQRLDPTIIKQTVNVISGNSIKLFLFYALIGESNIKFNLELMVSLKQSGSPDPDYYLKEDGSWSTSTQIINYKTNLTALPLDYVTRFTYYDIIGNNLPVSGELDIRIYFRTDSLHTESETTVPYLYVTDVGLLSSSTQLIDLKVNLLDDKLIPKLQFEIVNSSGYNYSTWFIANPKDSDVRPLTDYFDANGVPNWDVGEILASSNHGPHDDRDVRYPVVKDEFATNVNSPFYKAEMVELTIYKGGRWRNSFLESWRRHIKGMAVFAREEYYKTDEKYTAQDEIDGLGIEGDLKPPEGEGWEHLDIDSTRGNKRLWVRTPFNGAYTNDWTRDTSIDTTGGRTYDFDWIEKLTSRINYPIDSNSQQLNSAVDFRDICRKIFRSTHSSLVNKEVYSAFFWNDSPYLSQLIKTTGVNYVTGQSNLLNNIAVVHSTDLKPDVELNSSDNILELSFKDFFDDLNISYNNSLIWFMDEDKNLHIEHKKFTDLIENYLNILDIDETIVGDYSSYDFDKEKIYARTEIETINSGYIDFLKSNIEFDKIVSNKRGKDLVNELTTKYISTDIQYSIENPTNLRNGLILCATEQVDGETVVRYGTGFKTGQSVLNGDLSLATTLATYGNYEGVWRSGKINGNDVNFKYTLKIKRGTDIKLKGIVSDNFLLTALGIATATKKIYDYGNEETIFSPVYRHYDFFIVISENNLVEI